MQSDQKYQEKSYKYYARVESSKLVLQINDGVTYRGQIVEGPYYDILELKSIFQRGDIQVLTKTSSKMVIKLAVLKIQMLSEESHQLEFLKAKIQQLENKLKHDGIWQEEDLDSKTNFDSSCIYRIFTNQGLSLTSTSVNAGTIYAYYGSNLFTISVSNKKTCYSGWTVTKLLRKKCDNV